MKEQEQARLKNLLRQALPPIASGAAGEPEPGRDLWPAVLKRLEAPAVHVPWFDWALIAGVAAATAIFPAAIPVLLYYL
jgi:hypothetical protein